MLSFGRTGLWENIRLLTGLVTRHVAWIKPWGLVTVRHLENISEGAVLFDEAPLPLVRSIKASFAACGMLDREPERLALLRALVALSDCQVEEALAELTRHSTAHIRHPSAMVADLLRRRLLLQSDGVADYQRLMSWRIEDAGRDDGAMTTLVVSDYPLDRVLPALDFLREDETATVITASMGAVPPVDTPHRRYVMPSVFVWHSEEGRRQHAALERYAGTVARHLCARHPEFEGVECAVKFHFLDTYLYKWLVLANIEKAVAAQSFDRIVVVTTDERFYFLVSALARHLGVAGKIQPAWLSIPSFMRNPLVALWPERASVQILRGWHRAKSALGAFRGKPAIPVIGRARVKIPVQPAILGWNLRDRNYVKGLERVLLATLVHRPVVLFVDSDTDEKVAALSAVVAPIVEKTGHEPEIVRLSSLAIEAREGGQGAVLAISEILADPEALFEGETETARLMRRQDAAINLAQNIDFRVIAEVNAIIGTILERTRPAYSIFASGRASVFAAIAERLRRVGIPSMDAHIYLVGNHARQITPPTTHYGVIDDQQEALVRDTWNARPERVLRVGYFWREVLEGADEGGTPEPPVPVRAPTVLICTQPGDPTMVRSFINDVLDCIVELEDVSAIIKPHPVEQGSTLDLYDAAIAERGLGARVRRDAGRHPVPAYFKTCHLVMTRTSNAGIEAALQFKPVIRYIEYDRYDPGVQSSVIYARNVLARADLPGAMRNLLRDARAMRELFDQQCHYMRENPAQAAIDGAGRMVAFLEAQAAAGEDNVKAEEMRR